MLAFVLVIAAVVVLAIIFGHGIRVRLIWGSTGFLAGLICGILLTLEIQHRRRSAKKT
jgi:peptidoglycan/LPS O-acetylase OafA/YrhL